MRSEITVFLVASLPIVELRGAIPLAVGAFGFSAAKAFAIAVAGNFFLVIPLLVFLEKFSEYMMHRWYFFNRLMTWVFERTRKKHLVRFHGKEWIMLALFLFVAVPLPMTGAWSGVVESYVLGLPRNKSVLVIFLGVLTAGVIVTVLTSLGFMAAKSFN